MMGLAKLWVLTGERTLEEGRRARVLLEKKGIKFVRTEARRIRVEERSVETDAGLFPYDYLIVALGAELAPELVPGFREAGLNLYDPDQVMRINLELSGFSDGRLMVLICSTPFKCPPAPYEAVMLIDGLLRRRSVRDSVEINVFTAEPMPVPAAGPANSAKIQGWLKEKGLILHTNHKPVRVDSDRKEVLFENGEKAGFDLLVGVPPHRAPAVVRDSGLVDGSGWIPVEPRTLKTSHDRVFAVGDNAGVKLPNGLFLPKAGFFAEAMANVVAEEITAEVEGGLALAGFDAKGTCYIESGNGKASILHGDFFASPGPRVEIEEPSVEGLREKHLFEDVRLRRWFEEG